MPPDRFDSRVPSSAVPQTKREARQRQRQIARLAEQRAGFDDVGEGDVTFEGGEFTPTDETVDEAEKSLAAETAADREFVQIGDIDVGINQDTLDVETLGLSEEGRAAARQRQADELRSEAASESERFDESDFVVDRSGEEVTVEPAESALDRERRETAAADFESSSEFVDDVSASDVKLTDDGAKLVDSVIESAESRAAAERGESIEEARADFAADLESGEAFGDAPAGVNPASIVDDVDPERDIVETDDGLEITESLQDEIDSRFEPDRSPRERFEAAVESGDAFDDAAANIDGLAADDIVDDIDPESDIVETDDGLALAGDVQTQIDRRINKARLSDVGEPVDLGGLADVPATVDRETREAIQRRINETSGEVSEVQVDIEDGRAVVDRVRLSSSAFDGFRDVETAASQADGLDGLQREFDLVGSEFESEIEDRVADQINDQSVAFVDESDVDLTDDGVRVDTPDELRIDDSDITADGLTEEGEQALARRQLQSLQSDGPLSAATPLDSAAFDTVSEALADQAGSGSLSGATDILGASDPSVADNIGDFDDVSDAELIASLDPEAIADESILSEAVVEKAQQDIREERREARFQPGVRLDAIASSEEEFAELSNRIGVGTRRGEEIRSRARQEVDEIEESIAAGDSTVAGDDVDLTLTDDLSGVRSISSGAEAAIAERAAADLPNFADGDIDVGVSDGSITTSVDDSVRARAEDIAIRTSEIQARNEIADETAGIDAGDIEVDAGEGVSPTDELVSETLGSGVDVDVESFDQLEAAANIQARRQARRRAIETVETETLGTVVDPSEVDVKRASDGFEANVSGAAVGVTNLSAVDAAAPVDETIELASEDQGGDEPLIQAGDDLPDSVGEVPGAVAEGGEFVDVNAPTRPPEIRRAVSDTTQDAIGVDIDRDIARDTLRSGRSIGRDVVTGDFDVPDGSPVAGAAGIAVAAPEPVSTGTGAAILGGLALGGAITGIASSQAEIDVPDRTPASGFGEIDIGQTRQDISEIDVPDRTPAADFGEVDIPDRATNGGEIDVPEQTPASGTGEVDIPSIDAAQLIGRGDLVEEEEEDETVLGGEDIPINPFENPREQGSTPERFIREDRDAFVIRNPEINTDEAAEPAVDGAIDTGVGSDFGTGTGVGGGTEPIVPVGSDRDTRRVGRGGADSITAPASGMDTLSAVDAGAASASATGIDTDTDVRSDVDTGADARVDTPTREDTATDTAFAEPTITETVPGFESSFESRPNRTGRTRRRPRRPNVAVDPDQNSGEEREKQALDSEIAEFDFLTLDETDDRIEDVLGGG